MGDGDELLPEAGELVVATIVRIMPYGAYASLDEYNGVEGLLHISEISSRWVKNIRNHVREKQKTVLKVLRVDPGKRHIDLSLRRVNERERREKLLEWKRERRGRKMFDMAADRLGIEREKAYREIGRILEDRFGDLYECFETVVLRGEKPLVKAGLSLDWVKVIREIAESKVKIPRMRVTGTIELTCKRPNGIVVLRDAFNKAGKVKKPDNADIKIYVTGAPKYRVEVTAESYKEAEKILEKVVDTALSTVKASGGEGSFKRSPSRH